MLNYFVGETLAITKNNPFRVAIFRQTNALDAQVRAKFNSAKCATVEKRKCLNIFQLMQYDFHIHDAVRVEYRVATDGASFPRGYSCIERETRSAGGNGVIAAVTLARWGARVLLTGNAIGDDDHGKFLRGQLEPIENLSFEAQVVADAATPYAILLRAGKFDVGTLLSSEAARLQLPRLSRNSHDAQFFGGAPEGWGETAGHVVLEAATQDYNSLIGALAGVASIYGQLMENQVPLAQQLALGEAATQLYAEKFGGLDSIPSLEELEAYLSAAR